MNEQKTKFEIACEKLLDRQNIGELRAYGRHVGVEKPTLYKKGVLIQAIIDVLVGRVAPIPRSTRGAPVTADYFDPQIEKEIQNYRETYASLDDLSQISEEEAAKQMRRFREELGGKENVLIIRSSEAENLEKSVVVGQVQTVDGVSSLVPLSGETFSFKILVKTELIYGYSLREGDVISCSVQESTRNCFLVTKIFTINGQAPSSITRFSFEEEDVYPPETKISLTSATPELAVAKYLDWFIPLGAGQRCLVYGAPKIGKTHLLQSVAASLSAQEEYEVFALLIEQPPEAVSSFKRIMKKENVAASVYGDDAQTHAFIAELVWKRAKRFAEMGKDVVLLIDGIVNLAEAVNELATDDNGKTPIPGLGTSAVRYIKKFFAAARNFEKSGSLTIIATAKHSTGNPASDFLSLELLDMANCRIVLREDLALKRVYPAIDLMASGADQAQELLGEDSKWEKILRSRLLPKLGEEKLNELLLQSDTLEEFMEQAKINL